MKTNTIFARLMKIFIILLAFTIILGAVGLTGLFVSKEQIRKVYDENILGISYASKISDSFFKIVLYANKAIVAAYQNDATELNTNRTGINSGKSEMVKNLSDYSTTIVSDDEELLVEEFEKWYNNYVSTVEQLLSDCEKAIQNGDMSEAEQTLLTSIPIRTSAEKALVAIVDFNQTLANSTNESAQRLSNISIWSEIILLVSAVSLTIFLSLRTVVQIEDILKSVAAKLIVSSEKVDSATSQLNEASELLASGSSKQAAAIEETSATMNESASMIAQNAENTRHAAQLADVSKDNALKGKEKMSEMVRSMEELKESSDTISKIIKTIDEIAFQTNLLAINATVEAARAGGDAGRSFNVVADEVRNLAQKSAKAAGDTAEMIQKNILLTNSSRDVSYEVASTLETITTDFENLNKIIGEVNAASEEQANGIKQINIAISQMEKVTQENAAVAQENAATSNSMKDEVANLNEAIEQQKAVIKDKDSIKEYIAKEENRSSSGMRSYSSASSHHSSSSSDSNAKPQSSTSPKSNNLSPKFQSSTTSSSKNSQSSSSANEAEKIIPLDSDDDF